MFNIPQHNEMKMSWEEAESIIMQKGNCNVLSGLTAMQDILSNNRDDDDFFDRWCYEVNAYNIVFQGMSELLGTK
mgnify:FL=1|jgi:hypothetical protein|tara:strand:- start:327 stop:551 length:225 start_codon:yes stop_codon:yes gene_type:complete